MIRNNKISLFVEGLSLVLLTLILTSVFFGRAELIPKVAGPRDILAILTIILIIVLYGMVIGRHLARQHYFGRVLELNQLKEGEYPCNKNTGWMIGLNPTDDLNPRFIQIRQFPSIEPIPLGMDFTLTVSTERGKETRSGAKRPERFTRRLFKASWKDPGENGGLAETRWSIDV